MDARASSLPAAREGYAPDAGAHAVEECPALSVILPNHNHAAFISRALEALLAQERPADEIIVIDDASTDDSLNVIGAYAGTAALRLLKNPENLGVVATLSRGLALARGRYVYLAASDDWVLPGFFARAVAALDAHPEIGFFCGDALLVDGATCSLCGYRPVARPRWSEGVVTAEGMRELLRRIDNFVLTGSAIYRRDLLRAAGGLDERLGSFADGYLSRKLALMHGFYYAPVPAAAWRIFPTGYSRQAASRGAERQLQQVPPILAADPAFPTWYAAAFRRRWRFATCRLALDRHPIDHGFLLKMGAQSGLDRAVLATLLSVLPASLARVAVLAFLCLRWRPTRISSVMIAMLQRRFAVRGGDEHGQ